MLQQLIRFIRRRRHFATELRRSREEFGRLVALHWPEVPGLSVEVVHLIAQSMKGMWEYDRGTSFFYDGFHCQFRLYVASGAPIDIDLNSIPTGAWVQTNGVHFVDSKDPAVAKKYVAAFKKLAAGGGGWPDPNCLPGGPLVRRGAHPEIFELTASGRETGWKVLPTEFVRKR